MYREKPQTIQVNSHPKAPIQGANNQPMANHKGANGLGPVHTLICYARPWGANCLLHLVHVSLISIFMCCLG